MPARLPTPLAAAVSRCSNLFATASVPRIAVAGLHSTARLAVPPRHAPSSGASFLNLDNSDRSSPNGQRPPAPRFGGKATDANAALSRVLFDSETRRRMYERREEQRRTTLEKMAERKTTEDYARFITRNWRNGDVYSPGDLGPYEMQQWKNAGLPQVDVMEVLGINMIDEYRNFSMISGHVTSMGRILGSLETGYSKVNQRRMAKAVRRANGLGIHPRVHKHPELLMSSMPKAAYRPSGNSKR